MTFIDPASVTSFATDLGANVSTGIGDLWPVLLVISAIPLAFYILNKIVSFIKRTAK